MISFPVGYKSGSEAISSGVGIKTGSLVARSLEMLCGSWPIWAPGFFPEGFLLFGTFFRNGSADDGNIIPKCKAVVSDIPFTAAYVKTNAAGEEVYFVQINKSYTESSAQKYQVYLTTTTKNGIKTVSNYYALDKMQAGINVRISRELRLQALPYGIDKMMIRVQ